MKYIKVLSAIIMVSLSFGVISAEEDWKLGPRFASLNIVKMINKHYPHLSNKAETISHYSGYYSINPFLLAEIASQNKDDVIIIAKNLSQIIDNEESITQKSLQSLPNLMSISVPSMLVRIEEKMSQHKIIKLNKQADNTNLPVMDFPFDHEKSWYFNGVHTWTGDDNGDPMSSIDLTRSWSSNWGEDLTSDWVVAAHDGIVSRFSSCFIRITHESGWATDYYHLDNTQFETGDEVRAGQKISNYANNLTQATCQGGHSSGPHLHFALVKDGERYALHNVEFSKWKVHPGQESYDRSHDRMWLVKNEVKKYAYQNTLAHLHGDNEIDYRYSGLFSSTDTNGHGVNIIVTQLKNENTQVVRNILFIAFYTYDDDEKANFYAGNTDFDNWRVDETITTGMIQTNGGDFTNLQAVDFDNDVIDAGSMSIHFLSCSQLQVSFSLLEPVSNEIITHDLVLTKAVGIPDHVCQAPSLPIN